MSAAVAAATAAAAVAAAGATAAAAAAAATAAAAAAIAAGVRGTAAPASRTSVLPRNNRGQVNLTGCCIEDYCCYWDPV